MAGTRRDAAAMLDGFGHVVQSMAAILTTPVGSRIMRRDFGSDVPDLIDRPLNEATVLDAMVAAADALDRFEPRFRVETVSVDGGGDGHLIVGLAGTYFPRGHLGDFTRAEARETAVTL